MREGLFIKKNKDRWERIQNEPGRDADETAKDFVQLVDDLGYSKTFYPHSRVTRYLNSMAARIYLNIYANRKEESNRFLNFWKYDVPITIRKHRRIILVALAIFFLFFAVGFFSASKDPQFVSRVLSPGYVALTEQNIEEGNPFGVYQDPNAFIMFVRIMINNIIVSFKYFFKGIFLGVPSLVSLGQESIRLGAFEHMFYSKGLGLQAITTVLIHGLLELTAIIIACAGGVIMGTSFLFPGTKSRIDAFKEGTKDGVKLVVGLVPVFMIAALYEGYITRHYKMPLPLNLFILLTSAIFIVWYFIIYPGKLYKKQQEAALVP